MVTEVNVGLLSYTLAQSTVQFYELVVTRTTLDVPGPVTPPETSLSERRDPSPNTVTVKTFGSTESVFRRSHVQSLVLSKQFY